MNIYVCFFYLSFKKYNKLDAYIYTYFFFIISIIPLNNFFYNKDCCVVSLKKTKNIYIFSFNQNQNFIKKKPFIIFKCYYVPVFSLVDIKNIEF